MRLGWMGALTGLLTLGLTLGGVEGSFGGVGAAAGARGKPPEVRDKPWEEILGPAQGSWPEPLPELEWRSDLRQALLEARESGRPLLVTARCQPCQQCATIDKQVLDGGPELTPLLSRFITVRLTDALDLDLALLPVEGFQDLDASWWVYFLSPEGRTYGVFGGRDEISDATRVSVRAMVNTLRRVLDHHGDPRRARWDIDGPLPAEPRSARELPGYRSWREWSPDAPNQDCLHCHQVVEILRHPAIDAGTFDVERDVAIWPYPENIGLSVDRDHGLKVTAVVPGSPASKAGAQIGDELAMAGGRRLFGQTDLRAVLHREAWPAGEVELGWLRGGHLHTAQLTLEPGWRTTVLDWRMSISQGNIGPSPGFFPLRGRRRDGADPGMAVSPFFGRASSTSPAFQAGLRPGHVIVAVNGESPDLHSRPFLVWFRLNHPVGSEITLTVLEGEQRKEIRYTPEM